MNKPVKLKACEACGATESERLHQCRLWDVPCCCGYSHRCCKVCRRKTIARGEFPSYEVILKVCPIAVKA
jgi:hypothetical protein